MGSIYTVNKLLLVVFIYPGTRLLRFSSKICVISWMLHLKVSLEFQVRCEICQSVLINLEIYKWHPTFNPTASVISFHPWAIKFHSQLAIFVPRADCISLLANPEHEIQDQFSLQTSLPFKSKKTPFWNF